MILCALLRPSLTPVRSLIVTGISPSALDIPATILPSFAGASNTAEALFRFEETTCQATHKRFRFHFEDKVDRTSTVYVDEVYASCIAKFAPNDLGGWDHCAGLVPRKLNPKHGFRWVPSNEGEFGRRSCEKRGRKSH